MRSDPSLVGRVSIVTGASRGLGKEMALALAEAGGKVAVTARANSPDMETTLEELRAIGGRDCAVAVFGDVRDYAQCERQVAETLKAFGAVHALFNNAGLGIQVFIDHHHKPRNTEVE